MKRTKFKAVIFDLDGTLVDTIGDIAAAMNRVLREDGFPEHSAGDYMDIVGYGLRITAGKALPPDARDPETVRRSGEKLIRYYAENPVATTFAYAGIPEMLTDLAAAGVKTAILSNKAHALVETVVEKVLGGFKFSLVLGAGEKYPLKPDPSSALALARDLGVAPEDVLFVGDSEVDVMTAAAAGMYPAGVSWGFRTPGVLTGAGAAVLFEDSGEIYPFVGGNGRG